MSALCGEGNLKMRTQGWDWAMACPPFSNQRSTGKAGLRCLGFYLQLPSGQEVATPAESYLLSSSRPWTGPTKLHSYSHFQSQKRSGAMASSQAPGQRDGRRL